MKYAIVVSSKTGNTRKLALEIQKQWKEECIYFGEPAKEALEADILCVGFWTDKGTCSSEISTFLESCAGKKIFLFGTAGFGGDTSYFERILQEVRKFYPENVKEIGSFMCQGKMPTAVRTRYENMTELPPERKQAMLDNFDRALSHPDQEDIKKLCESVSKATDKL